MAVDGLTPFRQIQAQVKMDEELLRGYKRKIAVLRRAVVGDYHAVDPDANAQVDTGIGSRRRDERQDPHTRDLYDVLTTDVESGLSNEILENMRTLVAQCSYQQPNIEAENVEDEEAAFISLYLKATMGPKPRGCNALQHMKLNLAQFLADGIGCVWNGLMDGKPNMLVLDTKMVSWDTAPVLMDDITHFAFRLCRPLWRWVQIYGEEPFSDLLEASVGTADWSVQERGVELMYYYNIVGQGTHAVWRSDEGKVFDETTQPIEHSATPHFHTIDNYRQPFLPIEFMRFMQFAEAPIPISLVEMQMPHMLQLRQYQKGCQRIVLGGVPFYIGDPDALDETNEKNFLKAIWNGYVKRKKPGATIERVPAAEMGTTHQLEMEGLRKRLTVTSGADPYSSGQRVEDVKFSREIAAIQENAGLIEGLIRSEVTASWARSAQMFIWNGRLYDFMPRTLNFDGDVLEFGPENPVGVYLREDADLVVSEDATAFVGRDTRIVRALQESKAAAEHAAIAPGWARLATEKVVRAFGHRNIRKAFESPAPVAGTAPVSDAAMAAASMEGQ